MHGIKTLRKLPRKLILPGLLAFLCGLLLPCSAVAQQNSSTPTQFPPALVQSWKNYMKNYPLTLAQFQKMQELPRRKAKPVAAKPEANEEDLVKTYPFLQKDLETVKRIEKVMADSLTKNMPGSAKQSLDVTPHVQIAEDKDSKTGINLFFIAKSGPLWCSSHGCPMDVYVDTGTGYQKAGSYMVLQNIYVARIDKNVFLFAAPPEQAGTMEWVLKGNKFAEIRPPSPEPQSQAFLEWKTELQQAGKWPPQ